MQIKVEQLFYGRGKFGYGVLASSQGGKPFAAAVESLCAAVGSPDVFLPWKPFLVNRLYGDYCLMACVQPGVSDSSGRATVLFHVLVALASEMTAAGVDAFTLFDNGLFHAAVQEKPEAISVGSQIQVNRLPAPFHIEFPAVVSASAPESKLIRGLLGADSVRRSWATFAFHPMAGFDIYALNARAALPADVVCYDSNGKQLSASKSSDRTGKMKTPISDKTPLFATSLIVNVGLLISCAFLLINAFSAYDKSEKTKAEGEDWGAYQLLKDANAELVATNAHLAAEVKRLQNDIEQKGKSEAGLVSRESVILELKEKFESKYKGRRVKGVEDLGQKYRDMYEPYLRLVNDNILK